MIAPTATRVERNTSSSINQRIRQQTDQTIEHYRQHPDQIRKRLAKLDREWDIERTLIVNASALTLGGLALSILHDRRWLALPVVVQSFLLMHGLQGWCPPVPVFRRMGIRTPREIEYERHELMNIRAGRPSQTPPRIAKPATRPGTGDQPVRPRASGRQFVDEVNEASEGSFPASDPPSSTRSTATPADGDY